MLSVCGRGLEDFLFRHLTSPWTAFHGSAVLRGIYKKTHPAQWVGLGRLMWAGLSCFLFVGRG